MQLFLVTVALVACRAEETEPVSRPDLVRSVATRVSQLEWSPDGTRLAMVTEQHLDLLWTVATDAVVVDPSGNASKDAFWRARLPMVVEGHRAWIFGADRVAQRYVEAPDPLVAAARTDQLVAAADETGRVYLWSATTGEGLGTLGAADPVSAIAITGTTLAVARARGGVEIWDTASRSRLATLAPIAGVATRVLAHRPPPVAFAPTPPTARPSPVCLPADAPDLEPVALALAGDALTLCEKHASRDPYCFAVSLAAQTATPIVPPIVGMAPPPPWSGVAQLPWEPTEHGLPYGAVSADHALLAVAVDPPRESLSGTVDTYDTVTRKRIARFPVHYGTKRTWVASMGSDLFFVGHTLLASDISCIGPCGTATLYSARGRRIGALAVESSTLVTIPVGGERYLVKSYTDKAFTIQDMATGAVIATSHAGEELPWDAVAASDKIVRVLGTSASGAGAKVMVYSLDGALASELSLPRCSTLPKTAQR